MNEINKGKKLAVIGSRTFNDYKMLKKVLDLHGPVAIISGGANGADSFSQQYAKEKGLPILIYYPRWYKNGVFDARAGFERNTKIIEKAEEVVAFHDGVSKGTLDSIKKAEKLNKKVYVYRFDNLCN